MQAVGIGPQKLDACSPADWARVSPMVSRRTRISGRRALGLALPGLILVDAILVTGSFFAAVRILAAPARLTASSAMLVGPQLLALFAVLVAGFLLLGGMFGLYSRRNFFAPRRAMAAAARALFWSGTVVVAFAFLLALDPPGDLRLLLLTHAVILSVGVMTLRPLVCRGLIHLTEVGPVPLRRALILGTEEEARRVAAVLEERDPEGVEIAGLVGAQAARRSDFQKWPRFQVDDWQEASALADALAVDEVVVATRAIGRSEAVLLAEKLARMGVLTRIVPHVTGMSVDGTPLVRDRGLPETRLGTQAMHGLEWSAKRAIDLAVALTGGLLLLPFLLLIAGAVKLTSRGPVLYAQTRVGRSGRTFKMYKFRSMVVSNDDSHHRRYVASLLKQGSAAGRDADGRPVYKILGDPRVTLVGHLIRATSFDELPQLLNVLRGDMSLVGPRPCLPFEYDLYEEWQRLRLEVTPGITGLWQVSGRSLLSFEEMVLLDLYYVANWSFLLDLKILWRTIPEVFYLRGVR